MFIVCCSEVLASEEFHLFLITKNILLFGIDVNSEEGARVSYILRESRYHSYYIIYNIVTIIINHN